jgi:hypothetical protein
MPYARSKGTASFPGVRVGLPYDLVLPSDPTTSSRSLRKCPATISPRVPGRHRAKGARAPGLKTRRAADYPTVEER